MKKNRTFSVMMFTLMCLLYAGSERLCQAQRDGDNPNGFYWFEAKAEWDLDESGHPVRVIVHGTGNLPAKTKLRLWVNGGRQMRIPVTDGVTIVEQVDDVVAVATHITPRQNLAGGTLFPSLVPDVRTRFTLISDDIRTGKVIPGKYEVEVEIDTRQRPNLRDLLREDMRQQSQISFLSWGEPETLATYTAGIRKRFETDINVLYDVVQELKALHIDLKNHSIDLFKASARLSELERVIAAVVEGVSDAQPSDLCQVSRDHPYVIRGFCSQAILPALYAVRRTVEVEINGVDGSVPAPRKARAQLEMLNVSFNTIYEKWNLLKSTAKQALPALDKAVKFFTELPAKLLAMKEADDEKGFLAFQEEADMELVMLFAGLSGTVPAGEAKDLLLHSTRELYVWFTDLKFDSIQPSSFQHFEGELNKLRRVAKLINAKLNK